MLSDREFTRRMVQTVLTVTAVAIVVSALWAARDALMLIYISALIAMGFSPIVRIIEQPRPGRRPLPRGAAILLIYLIGIAVLILVGLAVVPPLVEQATTLWERLPERLDELQTFLLRHRLMTHRITLQEAVQNAPPGADAAVSAVNTVANALWGLVGGVFGLVTILILSFYLLLEAGSLTTYAARFMSEPRRRQMLDASREAVVKVSAWMSAQLILAGVMGAAAAIGLALMHAPYFYVIALIAAVGETVPFIGPIIAGVAAVAIALTSASPKLALGVGLYFVVLHQIESNVLVPKIMERRVGVSPVTVMIALLVGGALWGVLGAILAIPTAAILSVVVDEFGASAPEPHRDGSGAVP